MPVSKPKDLPAGGDGRWPLCGRGFRSVQWGDLEVGFTTTGPGDHTAAYQGLPGGVCPCPHYFYVFEGRIRCIWPDSDIPDEIVSAGEVCFFPSGHVLVYGEASRVLELNPAAALRDCMDAMERAAQQAAPAG